MSAQEHQTHCCECSTPLDPVSLSYAKCYPFDFRTGMLGSCCAEGDGAPEDDGWGDAPRYREP